MAEFFDEMDARSDYICADERYAFFGQISSLDFAPILVVGNISTKRMKNAKKAMIYAKRLPGRSARLW